MWSEMGETRRVREKIQCPRQESNLRTWLRRPMLYPLSYEGSETMLPDHLKFLRVDD